LLKSPWALYSAGLGGAPILVGNHCIACLISALLVGLNG